MRRGRRPIRRRSRVFRAVAAASGTAALAAVLVVALLSLRYDDGVLQVAHKSARYGALLAIRAGTAIHDPAGSPVLPPMGPEPKSWDGARRARAAFLRAHPGVRLTGPPDAPVPPPATPFRYGTLTRAQVAERAAYFHLPAWVAETRARHRALAPDDPWHGASADLYLLYGLNNLVNQLWRHAEVPPGVDFTSFSVIRMAERARAGEAFYCHVYAMALIELTETLGYQGRLLSLSPDGRHAAHAVTEVWVNDLGRWVLFDPDFNLIYGTPKRPMNALEARAAYLSGVDPPTVPGPDPASVSYARRKAAIGAAYRNIEWHFRSDYWSNRYFRGHPARSDPNSVVWDDPLRSNVLALQPHARRADAVYFPVFRWDVVPRALDLGRGVLVADVYAAYPGFSRMTVRGPDGPVAEGGADAGAGVALPVKAGVTRFALTVESAAGATVEREFSVTLDGEAGT